MAAPVPSPRWARRAERVWNAVAQPTADPLPFATDMADSLPAPVARWLRRSIEPGTPVTDAVVLDMRGRIKLGRWRGFRARQVLTPSGLVWAAAVRFGPIPVRGYDSYAHAEGLLRWRAFGVIPVVDEAGDKVTRSAAGRVAAEALLIPTVALRPHVTWHPIDDRHADADVTVDGQVHRVRTRFDASDRLVAVSLDRWGEPGGEPFGRHPFGAALSNERRFGGMLIPTQVRVGWFFDTPRADEGRFFEARIHAVTPL